MSETRLQIIETTCELLEKQGYHATGLNEIVAQSGSPKGSLYYYFPGGKEEIASEAIGHVGGVIAERVRNHLAQSTDPAQACAGFIRLIADSVEKSAYRIGGPLATVAMESAATNERLNLACREAYGQVQQAFKDKLTSSGYSEEQARDLAEFIVAAIEGGTILSRTYHSGDPLRRVARQIAEMLSCIEKRS